MSDDETVVDDENTLDKCEEDVLYSFSERLEVRYADNASAEYKALADLLSRGRTRKLVEDSKHMAIYENGDKIFAGSTELKQKDFFSFTEGMLGVKSESEYRRNYLDIKAGDRLFIWQTLSKDGPNHIVGHIFLTESQKHLSFGFGYLGESIKPSMIKRMTSSIVRGTLYLASVKDIDTSTREGVIYTPDYLFEHRILQQLSNQKDKYLNLIASAVLTQNHVDKIKAKFDRISQPYKSLLHVLVMRPSWDHYYLSYQVKIDDLVYCAYSVGTSKTKTNCAGFLQTLFGDIISCPGFRSHYRPAPEKCYQISKKAAC